MPIHITVFAMLIGIFSVLGCGNNLFAFSLINLFSVLLLWPLLEIEVNVNSFLAHLIYAFFNSTIVISLRYCRIGLQGISLLSQSLPKRHTIGWLVFKIQTCICVHFVLVLIEGITISWANPLHSIWDWTMILTIRWNPPILQPSTFCLA